MHPHCFLVTDNALALGLYPTHLELGKVVWGKKSQQARKKVQVLCRCFIVLLGGGTKEKKRVGEVFWVWNFAKATINSRNEYFFHKMMAGFVL
jgi:hypothetical protein